MKRPQIPSLLLCNVSLFLVFPGFSYRQLSCWTTVLGVIYFPCILLRWVSCICKFMTFVEFEKLYCFCPLSPRSFSFWSCGLMNNRLCDEAPEDRLVSLLFCISCWSFLMLRLLIRCYSCLVYFGLRCCLSSHWKLNLGLLTFPSALSACLHVSSLTSMWGAVPNATLRPHLPVLPLLLESGEPPTSFLVCLVVFSHGEFDIPNARFCPVPFIHFEIELNTQR